MPHRESLPAEADGLEQVTRVTLREVAKLAGAGTMTVSRVVNRSGYVSDVTRQRVEKAIEELGYVPNPHARSFRSQRSGTIALLVTDISNPYFTTIARGAEDTARAAGHLVLLGNSDEVEEEEVGYMKLLVQKGVDGVLLVPSQNGQAALELAAAHRVPVVLIDRRGPKHVDSVRCDSERGAFELGELLYDLGHRRFAILAGPPGVSTSEDRIEGFCRAVRSDDVRVEVLHGEFTASDGNALAKQALGVSIHPTAIFAINNFLAIGAQNALSEAGLRIPEDVSLVGFDDLPESMITCPFLTISSQPAYEIGQAAAQLLLAKIEKPNRRPEDLVLPSQLILRDSTAPPRTR